MSGAFDTVSRQSAALLTVSHSAGEADLARAPGGRATVAWWTQRGRREALRIGLLSDIPRKAADTGARPSSESVDFRRSVTLAYTREANSAFRHSNNATTIDGS